jgi:hypothetical protein
MPTAQRVQKNQNKRGIVLVSSRVLRGREESRGTAPDFFRVFFLPIYLVSTIFFLNACRAG